MKTKQLSNHEQTPERPDKSILATDLSPPNDIGVKELQICYDGRNYSWQVAPLQSLFPLHSGKANITKIVLITKNIFRCNSLWISTSKKCKAIELKKERTKKRKKKRNGLSPMDLIDSVF